jgi:hypothetical protein
MLSVANDTNMLNVVMPECHGTLPQESSNAKLLGAFAIVKLSLHERLYCENAHKNRKRYQSQRLHERPVKFSVFLQNNT